MSPQPSDLRLTEIYGAGYYEPWTHERPEIVRVAKEKTFAPVLEAGGLTAGARLLDVGCATGEFAGLAVRRGCEVFGVDLNPLAIDQARQSVPNATFHCGTLADSPFDGVTFDGITMIDFIEHVRDPYTEMLHARDRLAPGGKIMISTPQAKSVAHRLLRRSWPQYREEHITYLSEEGARTLLERVGLRVSILRPTTKMLTLSYLYGQALAYPLPVVTPLLRRTWRFLPVPKHRPLPFRFGEMTIVAERA